MAQFKTRRDYSINNVPVVGYQDSADIQDVLLWGVKPVTDTGLSTDANGILTVAHKPIIDVTHDAKDDNGTLRERLIDANDITIAGYYIGEVDGAAGTIHLYTDAEKTTSAANATGISVTYNTLVPITIDSNGKLVVVTDISGQTINVNDATPINVNLAALRAAVNTETSFGKVYIQDYTGWHPVCCNPDSDPRTPPFQSTPSTHMFAPLAVSGFNLEFLGKNATLLEKWGRKRAMNITKTKEMTALSSSGDYIWSSSGTNVICLMKLELINNMNEVIQFDVREGSTKSIINAGAASGKITIPANGMITLDFGRGYVFSTAAAELKFYAVTPASIDLTAIAHGCEL
mgnify:FL=1